MDSLVASGRRRVSGRKTTERYRGRPRCPECDSITHADHDIRIMNEVQWEVLLTGGAYTVLAIGAYVILDRPVIPLLFAVLIALGIAVGISYLRM